MVRPKQPRLTGMEDARIDSLHDAAREYADIRDQRMELNQREIKLKDKLLKLMHKLDRKTYLHEGVAVELVTEEETVRVRIKKPKEDEEATAAVSPGGPKRVRLAPDAATSSNGDGKVEQPVETAEEKAAFDADPRASSAEDKAPRYPKRAPKRSERGKKLQPVTSSKPNGSAPARS